MQYFEDDDISFVRGRLTATHCLYEDRLFFVKDVEKEYGRNEFTAKGYIKDPSGTFSYLTTVPVDELKFYFPLGYVNYKGQWEYVMRKAQRRWKQGLDLRSLVNNRGLNVAVTEEGVQDCISGRYPKFSEVVGKTLRGPVAISREFLVTHTGLLYYKGGAVGSIRGMSVVFDKEKTYLKELFEERIK